jgi:CubicO group peptidase (beta-lactamase class C family)
MQISAPWLRSVGDEVATRLGIAGAQAAVWDGSTLIEAAVGTANVETGVPVTPETLFTIGSTTKVFTAVLVMQLVDQGLLGLDQPVADVIPGFRLADPEATRTVTPRHLMSMQSGIDNGPYTDHGRGNDAVARYVAALADLPLTFAPGTGYGYSNASTVVSGRVVECLTSLDWDSALRQRVLEPAGLERSYSLTEDLIHRRIAVGHTQATADEPPRVVHAWGLPRSLAPAGATLSCSAGDLARFARIFLNDGVATNGSRILSRDAVRQMQAPQVQVPPILLADFWGLGPYGKSWDGVLMHGHSGTTNVGSSYLLWVPERNVAVATVVNCSVMGYPFAAEVFGAVFHEMLGLRAPSRPQPDESVRVDVSRLVGTYAMQGTRISISAGEAGQLLAAMESTGRDLASASDPSPLLPLTPTTFLPSDRRLDGNRGWALAFVGPDDAPATHLLNGVFALRRTA